MVKCLCLLVVIFVVTKYSVQQPQAFSLPRTKFGWKLINSRNVDKFSKVTLSHCAKECLFVKRCKSLQYDKVERSCKLHIKNSSEAKDTNWFQDNNNIFADRAVWPQAIAGSCAIEPCSEIEKCIPTTPPKCVPYCGYRTFFKNGSVPQGCYTVGCVLNLECKDGYSPTTPDMKVTCQENGLWSPALFQCLSDV